MKYISFKSIPYIDFAHRYFTEKYDLPLPFSKNTIEFTYHHIGDSYIIEEDKSTKFVPENSIFCLIHNSKRRVYSNTYQDHYSVCIYGEYEILDEPTKYSFPFIGRCVDILCPTNRFCFSAKRCWCSCQR